MTKLTLLGLVAAGSLTMGSAFAADLNPGDDFAAFTEFTKGFMPPCTTCHALDQKKIGPSYQDVAAKRAGEEGAADMIAAKIMKGNVGGEIVYGGTAMPPNAMVKEEAAKKIAAWVLSLGADQAGMEGMDSMSGMDSMGMDSMK